MAILYRHLFTFSPFLNTEGTTSPPSFLGFSNGHYVIAFQQQSSFQILLFVACAVCICAEALQLSSGPCLTHAEVAVLVTLPPFATCSKWYLGSSCI